MFQLKKSYRNCLLLAPVIVSLITWGYVNTRAESVSLKVVEIHAQGWGESGQKSERIQTARVIIKVFNNAQILIHSEAQGNFKTYDRTGKFPLAAISIIHTGLLDLSATAGSFLIPPEIIQPGQSHQFTIWVADCGLDTCVSFKYWSDRPALFRKLAEYLPASLQKYYPVLRTNTASVIIKPSDIARE